MGTKERAPEPPTPDLRTGLHRFFVEPGAVAGERVALGGPLAHQIARVLRLRVGERIVLLDGGGQEHVVLLEEVRSSSVLGSVEAVLPCRPEPRLAITLYQALVPRDRFEVVLQKGTEVGVSRFVPTWCERSIVPGGEKIDERRLDRWRRICTEAAEQCERGRVPEIATPIKLPEAIRVAASGGPVLMAWERETARSVRAGLRECLRPDKVETVAVFVGPEGGFSEREVALAREAGVLTVSLGPRILRTETAGPVLAALALYEAGDLEP